MPSLGPIADRALALAADGGKGPDAPPDVVAELAAAGDREALEGARAELLSRIYERSDDYQATAALTLVNKALAAVGWPDPYNWKHRRKP